MAAGTPDPIDLDEVVLVGEHPNHPYVQVVVIGSNGTDTDWAFALELAHLALSSGGGRFRTDPGVVVVDAGHDLVRPAKALRRIRRQGPP